ncbi:ABC transporter ATP-binding protein [Nitriliruptor alkaliphilus]|uniref:ABC transporter ATP-binding protein n=1 Tax=Nitriliruptor alkaliphilus TaxID=427918 RepID=UPI0006962DB4|nr:ATP-binding cassette domain-containing protein [Nitriliruptor alkaliphilus]
MIDLDRVSVTYDGAAAPSLSDVTLHVPEGELCLVVGPTGTGKTTLLKAVNGLVPHATGGTLHGRVTVAGRDTRTHPPRDLADVVGVVGQDPLAGMVTDIVEEELAYGMESLALPPDVMRRRVEETLDLLGLVHLRHRPIRTLSGGERQRVAIGAVLTVGPQVLVLDEPTSALDPPAAEEVLAALQRLVHDLGMTVLLAEHRLERVVQFADRVVLLRGGDRPPVIGDPATVLTSAPVAPPVVELGRIARWDPLPLTVRDARRRAGPLRDALTGRRPPPLGPSPAAGSPPAASVEDLVVRFGTTVALRHVDLTVRAGEVLAVMGRNGAGKSSLLGALIGSAAPTSGTVQVGGVAPHELAGKDLVRRVGLVPQQPADLLYAPTVAEECAAADTDAGADPGSCRKLLDRLVPGLDDDHHPRDLSEGQRLALVLSIVLTAAPPVLLLDEPTRGLDLGAKVRLVEILSELAAEGHAVVLATHDVELAAEVATRTVVLADGEVVADGPTAEVVVGSPAFAPQVSKVLAPAPWLTVGQVADALEVLP